MEIRDYVSKKVALLADVGITKENEQVMHLWKGLDVELQPFVQVESEGNRLSKFERDLYRQEPVARRLHGLSGGKRTRKEWNTGERNAKEAAEERGIPLGRVVSTDKDRGDRDRTTSTKTVTSEKKEFLLPRPCRHCGGNHWDNRCPKNNFAAPKFTEAYQVEVKAGRWDKKDENDYSILQTHASLMQDRFGSDSDSSTGGSEDDKEESGKVKPSHQ